MMDNYQNVNSKVLSESPLYSWEVQDLYGLGLSGLSDYDDAKFVDRKTGKIHFSTKIVIDKDIQWTSDGERLLFNGFLYDFCKEEEDPYFVVLDVKNKRFLCVYKGYAEHPRWNCAETEALFDNVLAVDEKTRDYLQRCSWIDELSRNLPVLHLENEKVVVEDGRRYIKDSVSPDGSYKVRFYRVDDKPGDQFEYCFDVYRLIDGQYVPLLFVMITPMVNGVDGFAWIDGRGIMYTQGGGHCHSSEALSVLNVRS